MAVAHQLKKADLVFHLDNPVMMFGYQIQTSALDMNQ